MVFVLEEKSNSSHGCQTRIFKKYGGILSSKRKFSEKDTLIDPKQASKRDANRADFLDFGGPFFKGNENQESADEERDLGEFDPDVEGNQGEREVFAADAAKFIPQNFGKAHAMQETEAEDEIEARGFEFFNE